MAYIDNSDTKKEINDAIRGNAVSNIAPTTLGNQVIPVIDVNPKNFRRINIIRNTVNTGTATLYTTPTDKDFFLCGANISVASTAVGVNGGVLSCTPKGDNSVNFLVCLTGNSALIDYSQNSNSVDFSIPVLLERGSVISTAAVGTVTGKRASFYGYTVEP